MDWKFNGIKLRGKYLHPQLQPLLHAVDPRRHRAHVVARVVNLDVQIIDIIDI